MIKKNFPDNKFKEPYFDGLYNVLEKRKKQYVILTILVGAKPWEIRKVYDSFNILANDKRNFITEYDLLNPLDYLKLIWFILTYPLASLRLLKFKSHIKYDSIFNDEVKKNLNAASFRVYIMYLVGKRLNILSQKKIKLISWYENISINKLLYRGLRDTENDCHIYGCQFYLPFSFWVHMHPLTAEIPYNMVPDEVLVSGKFHLPTNSDIRYKLGVSPRYNYLFQLKHNADELKNRNYILILLTIDIYDSKNILKVVKDSHFVNEEHIYVKLHPNHIVNNPGFKIPYNWKITNEQLDYLCGKSKVVISSGSSGAILEAATMGCSAISIGNENNLGYSAMSELGKGEIWDIAFDSKELVLSYNKITDFRKKNIDRILELSIQYRNLYFTEATDERIVDIFGL